MRPRTRSQFRCKTALAANSCFIDVEFKFVTNDCTVKESGERNGEGHRRNKNKGNFNIIKMLQFDLSEISRNTFTCCVSSIIAYTNFWSSHHNARNVQMHWHGKGSHTLSDDSEHASYKLFKHWIGLLIRLWYLKIMQMWRGISACSFCVSECVCILCINWNDRAPMERCITLPSFVSDSIESTEKNMRNNTSAPG